MNRQTEIINADDFFGDFANMNAFLDRKDGYEEYWRWPEDMGNGFCYAIKLRPGLILSMGEHLLWKPLSVDVEISSTCCFFSYSVSKTSGILQGRQNITDGIIFNSDQNYISHIPGWQGTSNFPDNVQIRSVAVDIAPWLLNYFLDEHHDQFPADLHEIANGSAKKYFHCPLVRTPLIDIRLHEIFNCQYQGPLKRMYLESKVLELIVHSLSQLIANKKKHDSSLTLDPGDFERTEKARNILIGNMQNPPSLVKLAGQVGLNKNKLNQNFRLIYGTSAFDYLRMYRLEHSKKLLENGEKNVAEIAFEVGYAQQCNFTKAFKNYFGSNPAKHLR
ncbi:AraC family transcriptional regulator [uncultured Desulfobacter sp.]|uniref:helix-turn-helix transcriptional regulator n=1 Tax=uncultured Desulfobacter sp. TaxID=240139 RepID=UPI002AA7210A|nr:AraC family transcriptional regulator [uncultured Desulfobacter sp.]